MRCALHPQISDLQADNEESQRTGQQLKKKLQRLTAELQDTKLHLEGQQSRNHDLEKKQRKSVETDCQQTNQTETHTQTDTQTGRQTDRHTDRQTDRHAQGA